MSIINIFSIVVLTFLTSLSFAKEVNIVGNMPPELNDCKVYKVILDQSPINKTLFITRCHNSNTISTRTSEKYPVNTTLIEGNQINEKEVITLNGKKYIKKDELIKNTNTINLNGFEYIELK